MQLQKQEHYINLQMDPLWDPLTTRPIQTGWEICIEPYPNRRFGCFDNPDCQFGKGSVLTRTQTRSDGPEPLLTLDVANVQYLCSSSREVLCRQSWWQRWSFWQFKCSRTIMLEVWPGCFDNLFGIGNVSNCCHLLGSSARFILWST